MDTPLVAMTAASATMVAGTAAAVAEGIAVRGRDGKVEVAKTVAMAMWVATAEAPMGSIPRT